MSGYIPCGPDKSPPAKPAPKQKGAPRSSDRGAGTHTGAQHGAGGASPARSTPKRREAPGTAGRGDGGASPARPVLKLQRYPGMEGRGKKTDGGAQRGSQKTAPARFTPKGRTAPGSLRATAAAPRTKPPMSKPKMVARKSLAVAKMGVSGTLFVGKHGVKTAARAGNVAGRGVYAAQKVNSLAEKAGNRFASQYETYSEYAQGHFNKGVADSVRGVKDYGGRTVRQTQKTIRSVKEGRIKKEARKLKNKARQLKTKQEASAAIRRRGGVSGKYKVSGTRTVKQGSAVTSRANPANKMRLALQKRGQQLAVSKAGQALKTAKAVLDMVRRITAAAIRAVVHVVSLVVPAFAPLILCIVIVGAVAAILASPFGLFYSEDDTAGEVQPIRDVVDEINAELDKVIDDIIDDTNHDTLKMYYPGSVDGAKINNWIDVLTIFAVRTTMDAADGMDVVTIDTTRVDLIREVFFDMNVVSSYVEKIEHRDDDDRWTERVLHITVTSKTAEQQALDYGFDDEQKQFMREMMEPEYLDYFYALLGVGSYSGGGLSDEELENILGDLPPGEYGSTVVELALSRLGDPYSQEKAGTGRYTDCSHLVQWAYAQVGITLPRTASVQAKQLYDDSLTIAKSDLQPGDLIFWSYGPNDKFMDIGHVGIYVSDGYVVHASSVEMQVFYEKLFHADKQVLYGRPS